MSTAVLVSDSAPAAPNRRIVFDWIDVAVSALLALLATSLSYRFGSGVQLEHIPIILRQIDQTYLGNDFFVSTASEFGPRWYFVHLVAWLCQFLPMHWVYASLTLSTDLALVLVTLWAARRLVGSDRLGSMLAAVLVIGVSGFHLGDATQIRYEVFQPASVAIPGILLAIALGLCGRPVSAAVVASISGLMHPLYGASGGAIALGAAFVTLLFQPGRDTDSGRSVLGSRRWLKSIQWTTIGVLVFATATALSWWPYLAGNTARLSTMELMDILGRFRAPHHYFPTQFRAQDFVTAGFFLTASILAFHQWSRTVTHRHRHVLLFPVVAVIGACLVGTLFVEIWPVRLIFTLQLFRLLSILKWIGYLLIGWQLARYWQQPPNAVARPLAGMSLLSSAGTQPLITTAALVLTRLNGRLPLVLSAHVVIVAMAAVSGLLWIGFASLSESLFLAGALSLLLAFSHAPRAVRLSGAAVVVAVGLNLVLSAAGAPLITLEPMTPVFDLANLRDVDSETARAAAAHTPADAVFVVPPSFGMLRIVGRRALVVDFKVFPFQDEAMGEWRERIRFVYGDVAGGGFTAFARLEDAYHGVTDSRLRDIARRYGATHALLHRDTETSLSEVYANDTYRVVALGPTDGSGL